MAAIAGYILQRGLLNFTLGDDLPPLLVTLGLSVIVQNVLLMAFTADNRKLDAGWIEETTQFIQGVSISGRPRAGIFRYARSPYAEPNWRDAFRFLARTLAGPGADQGLLIARDHYERLGGYAQRAVDGLRDP